VAGALLAGLGLELRELFLWALVPGAIAVFVLVVFVREEARPAVEPAEHGADSPARKPRPHLAGAGGLERRFWLYLTVLFVFTLGNSTDAFLLLRATDLGVPTAMVPLLWALHHLVKSALATWGGSLSDRWGRRPLLVGGWALYALVYLGFASASDAWHVWALFVAYGLFFAATEGAEKALVADLVPAARRGTAFGWYHLAVGLGALPASLLLGLLWQRWGAGVAFGTGAGLAVIAALGLAALPIVTDPVHNRSH
jgi:MFS family permease